MEGVRSAWDRVKRSQLAQAWVELEALGFIRSSFQFAGLFVLSFIPFLLLVSALIGSDLAHGLVERSGFGPKAARDVTSLFRHTGAGVVSQSVIGIVLIVVGADGVASIVQSWYAKVFGETVPTLHAVARRAWWLGGVVGFISLQVVIGRRFGPLGGPIATGILQFLLATLFWWWSLHTLLAGRVAWRRLLAGGVATSLCYSGVGLYLAFFGGGSIVSNEHTYGPIGTVMTLLEALIGLGVAVHLGAAVGARYGASSPSAFASGARFGGKAAPVSDPPLPGGPVQP